MGKDAPALIDLKPQATRPGANTTMRDFPVANQIDPSTFVPKTRVLAENRRTPLSHVEQCGMWNIYWASEISLGMLLMNEERDEKTGQMTGNSIENEAGYAYSFVTEDMVKRSPHSLGTHEFFVHGKPRFDVAGRCINWEGLYLLVEPKAAKEHRQKLFAERYEKRTQKEVTSELLGSQDENLMRDPAARAEIEKGTYFRQERMVG